MSPLEASDQAAAESDNADPTESDSPDGLLTEPSTPTEPAEDGHTTRSSPLILVASGSAAGQEEEPPKRQPAAQISIAPYTEFDGEAGPDPRHAPLDQVADGLCRIIQTEGPMLVERAYRVYLRGCGLSNLGRVLKSKLNQALWRARQSGHVVTEDEWGEGKAVRFIVRPVDGEPVIARERGPREFPELPPSELQIVARLVHRERADGLDFGSEEHLRAVLAEFGLRRLTKQVRKTLMHVLEHPYPHVDAALGEAVPK